jgi:PKD repeat protein
MGGVMKKFNLLYILFIMLFTTVFLLSSCDASQSKVFESETQISVVLETETANNEPIAKIGFTEEGLILNKEITFHSESTDSDNDILTYKWTLPDGTNSTGETTKYIFKNFGVYDISLKVSDGKSESTDSVKINIENKAPIVKINYNKSELIKNKEIIFTAVVSDPENGNLIYEWLLPDGTNSSQESVSLIFEEYGDYEIKLTVKDEELSVDEKLTVNIKNHAPAASISPPDNINCETGDTIHLSAADSIDPEGEEISFSWEFPDGTTSNKTEVDYIIKDVGTQSIKLVVSDGEFSDSKSISVDATMSEEYFKKSCENVKYGDLLRNPDDYLSKPIHVKGKIVQFLSNEEFHFNITRGSYGYWDDRAWLVLNNPPEENIIEDDIVEVWGFGGGNQEYETAIGGTNTIPVIFAQYVEIIQKAD